MTELRLSLADPTVPGSIRHLAVHAQTDATVGELAQSLGLDIRDLGATDPETPVSESSVSSGTTVPAPASPPTTATADPRIEAVAGPFAGQSAPLAWVDHPEGPEIRIGSSEECELSLPDPFLKSVHARLTKAPTPGEDLGKPVAVVIPEGEVILNGVVLRTQADVSAGDLLQLGSTILRIGVRAAADADVHRDASGQLAFNRASRIHVPTAEGTLSLPGEKPKDSEKKPLPWLSVALPVLIACVMAFIMQRPLMLLMAAASPALVIGSYFASKRTAARKGESTKETWRDEVDAAKKSLSELQGTQRDADWTKVLDPVAVRDIATAPTSRLWERRLSDDDAASVRLGVGQRPLRAKINKANTAKDVQDLVPSVSPVPITASLSEGVLGIAGPRGMALPLGRSIVAEIASARSPREARIVLLCGDADQDAWEWIRWLPQTNGDDACHTLIGNSDETRKARIAWLSALVDQRAAENSPGSQWIFDTQWFVVVDGARNMRTIPGMVDILTKGPRLGVFVIALDEDRARLPEETATAVIADAEDPTLGEVISTLGSCPRVLFDAISPRQGEEIARALAPVIHVGGAGDAALMPTNVRLVDVLEVDLDDPSAVVASWRRNPRTTRAVIGAAGDGPFAMDLAKEGPHGLVAGTTGSGKSEFLQSLVVSLALANRPDALNFVLVDYKGASAFAECENLPHTVGMVTNLDGRETERALTSLDAELKRREHILKELGAKDIDAAWAKAPAESARRGLARLVLVIDEFAELKNELPEFISGLVRIARVGRSLGVHLILATQRPSGAVTPEMQSNTNLRVCLRVTDKADSVDVLDTPEASAISASTPGRGYVRRGSGMPPAMFQSARVAGRRPGSAQTVRPAPKVAVVSWGDLGYPVQFPSQPQASAAGVDHDDTDLKALVALINDAASSEGIPKNPSPWPDALPDKITLAELPRDAATGLAVVLGLEDKPLEQAQDPLLWRIDRDSHVLFIGGSRSGRTSILRTMLAQIAVHDPNDLHVHVLDYGNGALLPARNLPHAGVVMSSTETTRLQRFMNKLAREIADRQAELSRQAVGDINEQRSSSPHGQMPFAVIVIDGYERLVSDLPVDALAVFKDQLAKVLREGPTVGVKVLIAADRAMLTDKLSGLVNTKYVLPMTDREDYRLAQIPVRQLPSQILPGRIFFESQPVREAQLAILNADLDGAAQHSEFLSAIEELTGSPRQLRGGAAPFRVDVLPASIGYQASMDLPAAEPEKTGPMIGVGGDNLSRFTLDGSLPAGFIVAGERGSGRSQALAGLAHGLKSQGLPLILVDTKRSALAGLARRMDLLVIDSDGAEGAERFRDTLSRLQELHPGSAVTLLIDNAEHIPDTPLGQELVGLSAGAGIRYWVSCLLDDAASAFKGPIAEAKRARQGLLLWPSSSLSGTQILGTSLPKALLGRSTPGRAAYLKDGDYEIVQIPLVD